MSDVVDTASVDAGEMVNETPNGSVEEPKVFDAEYVKSLRQEAAKYRTQAKDLAEKAKAYDEWQDAQKSEQQKLSDALAAAQSERERLQAELLRTQVASKKQLPPSLVERLRGTTMEELEADADALLSELRAQFVERQKPSPKETGAGATGEPTAITADTYYKTLSQRDN